MVPNAGVVRELLWQQNIAMMILFDCCYVSYYTLQICHARIGVLAVHGATVFICALEDVSPVQKFGHKSHLTE